MDQFYPFAQPFRQYIPAIGLLLSLILTGCSSLSSGSAREETPLSPQWMAFNADTGQAADWHSMVGSAMQSDVILVGEQHDNAIAHELELKLVNVLLADYPNSAIAMEMLERNEQAFVDLYVNNKIAAETLLEITNSSTWGGEENWRSWYQPIIDAVKAKAPSGARLIAANAPRPYVRLARLEGHTPLSEIASQRNEADFAIPNESIDDHEYRNRFYALMAGHEQDENSEQASINVSAYFRAQQVWDATMADAVLSATKHHSKVMLIIGDFHIAHGGGTLQRIAQNNRDLSVTTISIISKNDSFAFDPEDATRADFVIYTR